jgi:hypothetical protein
MPWTARRCWTSAATTAPTRPVPTTAQYGGIHFEDGDNHAREAGAKVGKPAWAKALTYFNGTAG